MRRHTMSMTWDAYAAARMRDPKIANNSQSTDAGETPAEKNAAENTAASPDTADADGAAETEVTVAPDTETPAQCSDESAGNHDTAYPREMTAELMAMARRDARAAHFIVDILAGMDPREAVRTHFPDTDTIALAEERGYRRARDEMAAEAMKAPSMYESIDEATTTFVAPGEPTILARHRASVWD